MKKRNRISSCIIAGIALLVMSISIPAYSAATKFPKLPKKDGLFYGFPGSCEVFEFKSLQIGKIKKYDKKVIRVVKENYTNGDSCLYIFQKDIGTTPLSFRLTSGKKHKDYSMNIRVKQYKNPFTRITLGKRDLLEQYKRKPYCELYADDDSNYLKDLDPGARFTVKLKRGWRLKSIYYHDIDGEDDGKYVQNGAKLQFPAGDLVRLIVTFRNSASGHLFYTSLMVEREDFSE